MLVDMKDLLLQAKEGHYAIPSPDYWDSMSARAFVKAAEKVDKPVILSFAQIHEEHLSLEEAAFIGKFYAEKASVPVALHLDHGTDMDFIKRAIELGFTSVMIDASSKTFEENVRITREVVEYAHAHGVSVEAELGHVGAEDENGPHALSHNVYTDPQEAVRFVDLTGVDALAVSIGTSHGAYKNGTPHINFEILKKIREAVDVPLVLHGGSGSGDDNLNRCAREGICKVNIYTDYILAARNEVVKDPGKDWMKIMEQAEETITGLAMRHYEVLNCVRK